MPTPTKGPRLGGSPAHEQLMLANLATSLFKHGRITTTATKAKRLRPLAERLVTIAKRDDLASRRRVRRVVREKDTFVSLFEEIAPRYATRNGGYTRIVKTGPRKGDSAPMAIIELVEELEVSVAPVKTAQQTARKAARQDAVAALAGETEEDEAVTRTEATAEAASDADDTTANETAVDTDDDAKDDDAKDDDAKDGDAKA